MVIYLQSFINMVGKREVNEILRINEVNILKSAGYV